MKRGLVLAMLATGVGAAHAEGFYVGATIGSPSHRTSVNGIPGEGRGASGKVFGGHELSPNFAVEAGFANLGHVDDGNGEADLRSVYLDGIGRYELAPAWPVYGSWTPRAPCSAAQCG